MDYRALGLKVGLEIHQQLDTHKLFCDCASRLAEEDSGIRFQRRLRPTQSELGEVDAAAIEEARRHLTFVYEATPNTCLVEADEEPPHHPNEEALDIALEISLLLGATPGLFLGLFGLLQRVEQEAHFSAAEARRSRCRCSAAAWPGWVG